MVVIKAATQDVTQVVRYPVKMDVTQDVITHAVLVPLHVFGKFNGRAGNLTPWLFVEDAFLLQTATFNSQSYEREKE